MTSSDGSARTSTTAGHRPGEWHANGADDVGDRPYVVVAVTSSVDGRVTLAPDRLLMDSGAAAAWGALTPPGAAAADEARAAAIEHAHHPQATLEGSGSLVPPSAGPLADLPDAVDPPDVLYSDFLPDAVVERPGRTKWFTVVDGRGRVRWTMKSVGEYDVLVLASRATPLRYLQHLRRESICYLVAGEDRVDLGAALRRMHQRLGVTAVVSTAGGGLNGALLRAGLVDELHLVVLPAAIGGRLTPSVFDGPELGPDEAAVRLELRESHVSDDGALRLRYLVRDS